MGRAHRFAFSAAQAILDRIRNRADFRLLKNERLGAEQAEAGRIGAREIAAGQQFSGVETAMRIDPHFVVDKRFDFLGREEFEFGDADAVLAGNDPVQFAHERHDARHRLIGFLQHRVVVGVHRNVGVNIAVARVHVKCHEHAAMQHAFVQRVDFCQQRDKHPPCEYFAQRFAQFAFPRCAQLIGL